MIRVLTELRQWLAEHDLEPPEVILKFPTREAAVNAQMSLMREWDALLCGPAPTLFSLASGECKITGIKVRFITDQKYPGSSWSDRHYGDGSW